MIIPKKIIISRIDSIGDVILTLPVAGVLKKSFPDTEIIFLGRTYTKPIIDACIFVDSFLNWDEISKLKMEEQKRIFSSVCADCIIHVFPNSEISPIAKSAGIKWRIATTNRLYHWLHCNKLVFLSRKNSDLHEAQLNLRLTEPIIGKKDSLSEIPSFYGLKKINPLSNSLSSLLDKSRFNLILHPKSKGSTREWGLRNFSELIKILPAENFKIFISGTKEEGLMLKGFIEEHKMDVTDITGKMSLEEFMSFINEADGLLACSTGPLHIAAALGKNSLGLYPSMRPIFPQRWAPIGEKAKALSKNILCNDCRNTTQCHCLNEIMPEQVSSIVKKWVK